MRLAWWLTILIVSLALGLVLAWLAPSFRGALATLPYFLVTELLFFAWGGGMSGKRRTRPADESSLELEPHAHATVPPAQAA